MPINKKMVLLAAAGAIWLAGCNSEGSTEEAAKPSEEAAAETSDAPTEPQAVAETAEAPAEQEAAEEPK